MEILDILEILEILEILDILEILEILFTAFLGLGSVTVESGMFFWCDLHSTMLRTASRRPVWCNYRKYWKSYPGNDDDDDDFD